MVTDADMKKKKKIRFILIIIGVLIFLCMMFSVIISASNPTAYSDTSRNNPTKFGSPVHEGDYTIVVIDVRTTTTSYEGTHYSSDANRLIIDVQITCELEQAETCVMKSSDLSLHGPTQTLNLRSSQPISSIDGGETVKARLETPGWIHHSVSLKGAVMEFKFQAEGFLRFHTAWFDLRRE